MMNTLLERLWSGKTKTTRANPFGVSAAIAAAIIAATVVVLVAAATRTAEAAFPGASGAIAYTSNYCSQTCTGLDVWRMAPDGFGATKLTDNPASDSQPAWSPEGTQIAFNSTRDDGDGTGDWDIYRMNAAGNGERLLTTNNTVNDLEPYWFPSETKIAFRREEEVEVATSSNIWVLTLDENGNPTGEQRLTTNPAIDIMPAVSPNGKLIAFASNRITAGNPEGDYEIYVMKALPESATNVPKQLTKNNQMRDWNPDWSPSGTQIVFESNRDGDDEIFVMNADGTGQKNLTNNSGFSDIDPVFSPDGRKIAFERQNPTSSVRDIYRMRADGTRKVNLTETSVIDANASWQPMP